MANIDRTICEYRIAWSCDWGPDPDLAVNIGDQFGDNITMSVQDALELAFDLIEMLEKEVGDDN